MKALLIFAALAAGLTLVSIFVSPTFAAIAAPILGWMFVIGMRKPRKI